MIFLDPFSYKIAMLNAKVFKHVSGGLGVAFMVHGLWYDSRHPVFVFQGGAFLFILACVTFWALRPRK